MSELYKTWVATEGCCCPACENSRRVYMTDYAEYVNGESFDAKPQSEMKDTDTSKELKVTIEKVREAAKSCPDASRVLKTLFPEAFIVKANHLPNINHMWKVDSKTGLRMMAQRASGPYTGHFYLDNGFSWEIKEEPYGTKTLVSTYNKGKK